MSMSLRFLRRLPSFRDLFLLFFNDLLQFLLLLFEFFLLVRQFCFVGLNLFIELLQLFVLIGIALNINTVTFGSSMGSSGVCSVSFVVNYCSWSFFDGYFQLIPFLLKCSL